MLTSPSKDINDLPRWLRLKEAAWYSRIGKQRLIALARDRQIRGFKDPASGRGDWVFDRLSLDKYRDRQAGTVKKKVLAIRERDRI